MALGIGEQKGFYDDKRQFQGKDLSAAAPKSEPKYDSVIRLSFVVAGLVGFLIIVAFWSRVLRKPQHHLPDPDKVKKQYSVPLYQVSDPEADRKKPEPPKKK
ncbi:MAG: hypothetical protein IT370_12885 [Deltaproteobacteria bacterium]|nr:hypothetical protein [Deltaproteobacteria bacterium]